MKKKILVGYIMDGTSGGIDRYLLRFIEQVWEEDIQIDFLSDRSAYELKKRLEKYKSRVFQVSSLWHPVTQYRQMQKIIQENGYDVVYLNISTAMDFIGAQAAKDAGVKEVILHSHSGGNDCGNVCKRLLYDVLHKICRTFLFRLGTRHYACSKSAGYWMYPKRIVESEAFQILYNAVDMEYYRYDEEMRKQVRMEMQVPRTDTLVLGHVGNFCYQKNQEFLVRVMAEVLKRCPNARLWCLGKGENEQKIRKLAQKFHIEEQIRFPGQKEDIGSYYQGMDVFVLPSRFEGLPLVGIEAQCMQLPCVFSDAITKEVQIQDHCVFLSLHKSPEIWAEEILKISRYDRTQVQMTEQMKCYTLEEQRKQMRRWICLW